MWLNVVAFYVNINVSSVYYFSSKSPIVINVWRNLCVKGLTMSESDTNDFIVKFVESQGQQTEYAVKAYEVL